MRAGDRPPRCQSSARRDQSANRHAQGPSVRAAPRGQASDAQSGRATLRRPAPQRLVRRRDGHRARRARAKVRALAVARRRVPTLEVPQGKGDKKEMAARSAGPSLRSSTRRKRPRSRRRSRVRRFRLILRTSRQPRVVQEVRVGIAPPTRESRSHAGFRPSGWRDPDSNRGHHDFQSCGRGWLDARNPWKPSGSPLARAPGRSPLFTSYCTQFRRWRRLISFFADALSGVAAGVSMEELS